MNTRIPWIRSKRAYGAIVLSSSLTAASMLLGGCAAPKQMAKSATEGAIEGAKEQGQARADGGPPPAQELAASIVRGTTEALDRPDTRAHLGRIIETTTQTALGAMIGQISSRDADVRGFRGWSPNGTNTMGPLGPTAPTATLGDLGGRLVEGFTMKLSRQLQVELGQNGDGPLAQSARGLIRESVRDAVAASTSELLGNECTGSNARECNERRVRDLSSSAAQGFVSGLGAAIQIPLLIGSFVAGMVGALIVLAFVLIVRSRNRSTPIVIPRTAESTR